MAELPKKKKNLHLRQSMVFWFFGDKITFYAKIHTNVNALYDLGGVLIQPSSMNIESK